MASPRSVTSLKQALVRTSQNRTTPSLLKLHNSASFVGLKATFSIPAAWPLSSVENLTLGFSGFPSTRVSPVSLAFVHYSHANSQTRKVLSAEPVATRVPGGFHAIDLKLDAVLDLVTFGSRIPPTSKAQQPLMNLGLCMADSSSY